MHMDDIDTTWFGVVREGHERPMFQDYGRYATIVAGVKNLRLEATPSLSPTSDGDEALYPSLISFVGQTGAGKSSLIKLLIDLKSEECESFETPVVGAVGRDVATSEDVHLYLDPDSSESQAPLLFADCEGLEGGERDPVAAKLKRKMASSQSQNNAAGGNRKPTSERELVWADTPKKQSRDFAVAHLYPRLLYTFSDVIVFVLKNPRYALTVPDVARITNAMQGCRECSRASDRLGRSCFGEELQPASPTSCHHCVQCLRERHTKRAVGRGTRDYRPDGVAISHGVPKRHFQKIRTVLERA